MSRGTETPLTDRELRYLTVLWNLGWSYWRFPYKTGVDTTEWKCRLCDAHGIIKTAVAHAPGCVFWNIDPAVLASLVGFEPKDGETI